ncbi:MAG: CDP-glycerol glycerophosphotransferase family protein [Porcipelethomonas sp.]
MGLLQKVPRRAWSFLNIINRLVPKNGRYIFLYSNLGFRDNVRAVFDHLIEHGYNKKYKIIVSINDWEKYAETNEKNVKYISNTRGLFSFFRSKYCYYCFGKYPVKPSKNQVVFNLWHGMPLKRVGNMVKGHEKTSYNYFTHLLCTSEFFRDIMKKSFNASDKQIFICGQPRTDEMLAPIPAEDEMTAKAELLGYDNRFSKMILWLPTFREDSGTELDILSEVQLAKLDKMLGESGWAMLVKLHPLSSAEPHKCGNYEHISIIGNEELEDALIGFYPLIGMSSCLITDYSSVYFDYMLLDRPIGFAISDIESYGSGRGFVFDDPLTMMPGDIIRNGDEFLRFVSRIIEGKDDFVNYRRKLSAQFNKYCDDKNCQRVLSVIDRTDTETPDPDRQPYGADKTGKRKGSIH